MTVQVFSNVIFTQMNPFDIYKCMNAIVSIHISKPVNYEIFFLFSIIMRKNLIYKFKYIFEIVFISKRSKRNFSRGMELFSLFLHNTKFTISSALRLHKINKNQLPFPVSIALGNVNEIVR